MITNLELYGVLRVQIHRDVYFAAINKEGSARHFMKCRAACMLQKPASLQLKRCKQLV